MTDTTRPRGNPTRQSDDPARGGGSGEPPAEAGSQWTGPTPHPGATGADRISGVVLGAAVMAMGLLTGLFYAFDVAVMPGLSAAEDQTLVDAMQQMIDLPAFPLTLLAALVLPVVALVQARRSGSRKTAGWVLAALACYAVMILVSIAVHFPLNADLMNAGDPARIDDLAALRNEFVTPWVTWNIVRTLALVTAFSCLVRALDSRARDQQVNSGPRVRMVGQS